MQRQHHRDAHNERSRKATHKRVGISIKRNAREAHRDNKTRDWIRFTKKHRHQVVRELAAQAKTISIAGCCRHLGMSKQAYYKVRKRRSSQKDKEEEIITRVMNIRQEQPRLGTHKLHYLLKTEIRVWRDKLFAILRNKQMLIGKRRKYVKTTNSKHWMHTYTDSSKQIDLKEPEQLWVADITYLSTREETLYLHLVSDAYSKQIIGYKLSNDLKSESTLKALQMAQKRRIYRNKNIVHHSDRGLQYCSKLYIDELQRNECKISMTQDGSPYDNAVAERINGILKDEFYCDEKYDNFEQAKKHVEQSIMIYNTKRPHLSCSMPTPEQMHQQDKLPVIKWNKKVLSTTLRGLLNNSQPILGRLIELKFYLRVVTLLTSSSLTNFS